MVLLNPANPCGTTVKDNNAHFGDIEDGLWELKIDAPEYDVQYGTLFISKNQNPETSEWRSTSTRRVHPFRADKTIEYQITEQIKK